MTNSTGYQVKLNMEEAEESIKRWWFILKWTDQRLINFYTKHLINNFGFNPIDTIRDFVSRYNCDQSRRIKSRLDMISGQAILIK